MYNEDLIDFCCSPDFVRHYASRGMTPDYPPEFYRMPAALPLEQIKELDAQLKRLELLKAAGPVNRQEVYELKHLVNKLTERVNHLSRKQGDY